MLKILFFVTEDWYFCTHRLPLAVAAKAAGHEVTVLTRVRNHGDLIRSHGLSVEHLEFSRRDRNPFKEIGLLLHLAAVYRRLNPDLAHHVALKPVLYGSVAAWLSGLPRTVNAIAGLGYVFASRQLRAKAIRPWIRLACRVLLNRRSSYVIVQNPDDRDLLVKQKVVSPERIRLIRGAGVDTNLFAPHPESSDVPLVILPARLLWDKGVGEFVTAARLLRGQNVNARFALVGEPDGDNPNAVPAAQIESWEREGIVEWWHRREDMPQVYAMSHIVCLPSAYGEGIPKCLLEAAACARAIVTTDAPGCREIVRHEQNGLLVPLRDAKALAAALSRLIGDPQLRTRMGSRGREIAMAEFSLEQVIGETLSLYREVLA